MSNAPQTITDELIARAQAWRAKHMPHTIPTDEPSPMCLIALDTARAGYYVHPLAPKDKMPLAGGNGYKDATTDETTIRAWWKATPTANVGINLERSGVLDIAPDSAEWASRFRANGMPRTLLYMSGGGAGHWHTWYRLPAGGPVARICIKNQYDIMSEGNAVAPGSIHPTGNAYVLYTKLLPVEDLPLAPDWAIERLQQHVKVGRKEHTPEAWLELPSGAVLAHSRRFQALCKANDQLRMVCAGEAVTLTLKSGGTDSSPSIQRSVFVNQLLRAKYPHDEIRALALHFSGVLESKPKWFKADIDNLLRPVDEGGYTPHGYSPESTGCVVTALRGGRHYEITTDEMLNAYHQHATVGVNGTVLEWTVNEAAARLKVSTGTIKRREAELIADGQIRRDYGRVILSPAAWQNRSQCIVTPQTAIEAIDNNVSNSSAEAESVYKNTIGSQFVSPQLDAVNAPESVVCKERARVEITHSPGGEDPPASDEWDGIDDALTAWERTTSEGRHFAKLRRQQEATAEHITQLCGVLRPAHRDLVSRVRKLAHRVGEPGWWQQDYAAMDVTALGAELRRLQGDTRGECVLSIGAPTQEAFYATT